MTENNHPEQQNINELSSVAGLLSNYNDGTVNEDTFRSRLLSAIASIESVVESLRTTESKGKRYRHYKGGAAYKVLYEATLESDRSTTMMVYKAPTGEIYTRPSDDFFELIEHEGKTVQRFSTLD